MIKFAQTILFVCGALLSVKAHATLITDSDLITDEHYITVNDIDFAWVSPVNVEIWSFGDYQNILHAPKLHDGWDYATDAEIQMLLDNAPLSAFLKDDGTYRNAVQFWNTLFDDVVYYNFADTPIEDSSNLENYLSGKVKSEWTVGDMFADTASYETFYVRRNIDSANPIPEPTSILIFALGILLLSVRNKFL